MKTSLFYWYCSECNKWSNQCYSWINCSVCGAEIHLSCVSDVKNGNTYNAEKVCEYCKDRFTCWTSNWLESSKTLTGG